MEESNEKYAGGFLPFHPIILVRDVLKHWLLILLAALMVGVATYIRVDSAYAPVYRTTTTYVVTTHSTSSTVYSNLTSASSLATVFSELLNSSVMRKAILQQIQADSFGGSIQAAVVPETNLLTVTVTASDPRTAFAVAQAVMEHHEIVTYQVLDSVALEVLQNPVVPTAPTNTSDASGQMKRMMFYTAVVTAALLTAWAYTRNTVRSGKEAREKLDCHYLGDIPHENKYKTIVAWLRRRKTGILIINPATSFLFAETIRKLRRRVEQQMGSGKVLMVTSLLENEGKSTVAVNLALSLAQKHQRVLLIDCDLRKPACHTVLEQTRFDFTVRDVLSGAVPIEDAVIQENRSKLYLLLERHGGHDSGDFVSSQEMKELLAWARNAFDYVVLDMPPMSAVSDAESMTAYADASLLVVRQNVANATAVNKAVETLDNGNAKLLGCVLNDVEAVAMNTGRGYGYGYGKYGKYGKYGQYGYGSYGNTK